ncbi:hypothetical protein CK203_088105 [Vitis vinifera]|uniref:Uncharacterized protein n=1 Tax=Vitis vinifera TaxID=29760 RepID=A0A438F6I3_VITVI|nr:hypothetical protein CK203_088105 [Vitis vinifera]
MGIQAHGCLKHERDRVSYYLPGRSHKKLFQAVEYELLSAHATELQEKKVGDGKTPPQQVNPLVIRGREGAEEV